MLTPQTIELLVPDEDVAAPELSIVIPSLNEALTIATFVQWCKQGLADSGVQGEILIVDSSTDRTPEIALQHGARVLRVPKRGLGRAYIDAIPFIRGKYVLMGDSDCTYDFRLLAPFVEKMREGNEFVMGSRFRGYIEPGSMPPLHQYFGTPVTTWILNLIYSSSFSDIHCGMRGISKRGLVAMQLQSQSWEYASEMVLKSVHLKLKTAEVPIRFLKEPKGRLSHHRRAGWLSPWQAGWINLKAMFIYGSDFFLTLPGKILLVLGLALCLPLTFGPIQIGSISFSLHWMLLGLTLAVLGLNCLYVGLIAESLYDPSGRAIEKWTHRFSYNKSVLLSGSFSLLGVLMMTFLLGDYLRNGGLLSGLHISSYLAVTGLLFLIGGFMTFTFTLVLHAVRLLRPTPEEPA